MTEVILFPLTPLVYLTWFGGGMTVLFPATRSSQLRPEASSSCGCASTPVSSSSPPPCALPACLTARLLDWCTRRTRDKKLLYNEEHFLTFASFPLALKPFFTQV